jgi:uncharacterized protein YggE
MTDPSAPVLSVRGEARRTVAPDSVLLPGAITLTAGSKPDALHEAAAALDSMTADLRTLGGSPLTPETERAALTWSAFSAATHAEGHHDPATGEHRLTGRVSATVAVIITVRDFALLDQLGALLAAHERMSIHHAGWGVDPDNPAWPEVRAEAIYSAIRKGRDYAAALGGTLAGVVHVADTGLLGGDSPGPVGLSGPQHFVRAAAATAGGVGPSDVPSLDPVPQELVATIEARFTAAGVTLGRSS